MAPCVRARATVTVTGDGHEPRSVTGGEEVFFRFELCGRARAVRVLDLTFLPQVSPESLPCTGEPCHLAPGARMGTDVLGRIRGVAMSVWWCIARDPHLLKSGLNVQRCVRALQGGGPSFPLPSS